MLVVCVVDRGMGSKRLVVWIKGKGAVQLTYAARFTTTLHTHKLTHTHTGALVIDPLHGSWRGSTAKFKGVNY